MSDTRGSINQFCMHLVTSLVGIVWALAREILTHARRPRSEESLKCNSRRVIGAAGRSWILTTLFIRRHHQNTSNTGKMIQGSRLHDFRPSAISLDALSIFSRSGIPWNVGMTHVYLLIRFSEANIGWSSIDTNRSSSGQTLEALSLLVSL